MEWPGLITTSNSALHWQLQTKLPSSKPISMTCGQTLLWWTIPMVRFFYEFIEMTRLTHILSPETIITTILILAEAFSQFSQFYRIQGYLDRIDDAVDCNVIKFKWVLFTTSWGKILKSTWPFVQRNRNNNVTWDDCRMNSWCLSPFWLLTISVYSIIHSFGLFVSIS